MAAVKRTLLVYIPTMAESAEVLTGFGKIVGIDHEGTITFELEGEDEFELGRTSIEIEQELETLSGGRKSRVISAKDGVATTPRKTKEKT